MTDDELRAEIKRLRAESERHANNSGCAEIVSCVFAVALAVCVTWLLAAKGLLP